MPASSPTLSLVVPCFNEEASAPAFFDRVVPVLRREVAAFEIICVDDGSRDDTARVLQEQGRDTPELRVISLSRNFGKEAALTAGLELARGDVVVPMDMDLQDPPEIIGEFISRWREGADVVIGVRADRLADSFSKRFMARNFYRVFNSLSELPIPQDAGDYRLMDRRVVDALLRLPERQRFMKGLMHWVGFRRAYVPFHREPRSAGVGKWRSWRLWNFALDGIMSFSTMPLRIWTYLGTLVGAASLVYMLYLIVRTVAYGVDVPGYASLAVLVLFSIAFNMISIGILGEYIGRIFLEVKGRPLYVVSSDSGETALGGGDRTETVAAES